MTVEKTRNKWTNWVDRKESETTKKLLVKLISTAKKKQKPVSRTQAGSVAKEFKAAMYCECSAKTREGIMDVFQEAIELALAPPAPPDRKPCIFF